MAPARAGDADDLDQFRCTRRRVTIPWLPFGTTERQPCEVAVQGLIRLRVRWRPPPYYVFVGVAGGRVGGVSYFEQSRTDNDFAIHVMALSWRVRRRSGHRDSDQRMESTLTEIDSLAVERAMSAGAQEVLVTGRIHEENVPSIRMARRHHFGPVGRVDKSRYHTWARRWEIDLQALATDRPVMSVVRPTGAS